MVVAESTGLQANKLQDLSRFINGGRPPALGGMIRGLVLANRSFHSNEASLVTELRNFLKGLPQATVSRLENSDFLDRLVAFGSARNAIAHVGKRNAAELYALSSLVLDGDCAGELLKALIPGVKT